MTNKPSRREFLKTAAAATLGGFTLTAAGCEEKPQQPQPRAQAPVSQPAALPPAKKECGTMTEELSGSPEMPFSWIDQDGKEVNINALKTSLGDKFATLSFGFQGCQLMCPIINRSLANIGNMNRDIVSIIVSVDPETDGKDQAARDAFMKHIREAGITQKTIALFPVKKNAQGETVIAPEFTQLMQERMGLIRVGSLPLSHSAIVTLYRNDQPLSMLDGMKPDGFGAWGEHMSAAGRRPGG